MYWFFPKCSRVSVLYTGHVNDLVCHVWWALQYLALLVTNRNLCVPRRRIGNASECVAKQKQYLPPHPQLVWSCSAFLYCHAEHISFDVIDTSVAIKCNLVWLCVAYRFVYVVHTNNVAMYYILVWLCSAY